MARWLASPLTLTTAAAIATLELAPTIQVSFAPSVVPVLPMSGTFGWVAEYEAVAAGKPTVEGALHAFLDTDLDLYIQGGEGWRNYGALGAQVSNTPEGSVLMDEHFDPVVLRLIDILEKALPGCSREDLFWGYHFVTGALMLTLARTGRIDRLSGGLCRSEDFEAIKQRIASFMAAGFHDICKSRTGL